MAAKDDAQQKIEDAIDNQTPAVEDSEWADEPQLSPEDEQALNEAVKKLDVTAEYDDTNGADDDEAGDVVNRHAADEAPVEDTPADEEIPAEQLVSDEEQVADQEPEYDPALLSAAGLADAREAEIMFGTPKALENAVRMMDQRAVERAQASTPQVIDQPKAEDLQRMDTPAEEAGATFEMPAPPEGEQWDDATVALVKGLQDQFSKQLEQQSAIIKEQQEHTQKIAREREEYEVNQYIERFDGFVNQLPDEWNDTLGKGSGWDLNPDSIEMKARQRLDQTAKLLASDRAAQGQEPLQMDELLSRSLRVAFPHKQEQAVRKQVEQEVSKRQGLKTARPIGRTGQVKTGESAAATRAEQWYAKRGMAPLPLDEFEYDDI